MKLENLLIRRKKKNRKENLLIAVVCIVLVGLYVDYNATNTLSFIGKSSIAYFSIYYINSFVLLVSFVYKTCKSIL